MPNSIEVHYGGEPFFVDRALNKARNTKGRVVIDLDGNDCKASDIVNAIESNYLEGEKVVVVDNAQEIKSNKELKTCFGALGSSLRDTQIVVGIKTDTLSDIWALLSSKGKLFEHKKFKTWENNNEVVKWLKQEARQLHRVLKDDEAELMFELVGNDLPKLYTELKKICVLVPQSAVIPERIIKLVVPNVVLVDVFEIVRATLSKQQDKALALVSRFYEQSLSEDHMLLIGAFMRQVKSLALFKKLLDSGGSVEEIASKVNMNVWFFKKTYMDSLALYSYGRLLEMMAQLVNLEIYVKSSGKSKRLQVEFFVLEASQGKLKMIPHEPLYWHGQAVLTGPEISLIGVKHTFPHAVDNCMNSYSRATRNWPKNWQSMFVVVNEGKEYKLIVNPETVMPIDARYVDIMLSTIVHKVFLTNDLKTEGTFYWRTAGADIVCGKVSLFGDDAVTYEGDLRYLSTGSVGKWW